MSLYPKADDRDPRWGAQRPAKTVVEGDVHRIAASDEDGAVPAFTPLDSEGAAVARMIVAMETDLPPHSVRNRGLAGSDDVATVKRILADIGAEVKACRAVGPADYSTATAFKDALPVWYLDADLWYNGLKAEAGVSTWADLKAASTTKEV